MKILNCNFFCSSICSLFWFPVLFSLWNIFFLSLFFFPDFELCFLFNIIVFGFKKPKLKNTNFWSKGGLQHNGFFLWTCVLQNVKSYRFLGFFLANFWLLFKKHYKNRHFSTFFKANNYKKGIFECYYLVQVDCYYLVQVGCVLKNANLDQIITFRFLARNCFSKKKRWNPYFFSVFDNRCFIEKQTWTRLITLKTPKLGPDNNSTAYIYIYIWLWSY